ncbi:hypothetical protein [Dyella sp. C9]|uniref:hypothetical protein n=1 Tax=Dyella sp. C9 TaxID=2202154 RepID=UPI001E4805D7|nr:hypothetical protein [Dyella sp. C9]
MAMQKAKPAHGVAATKHAATSDGTATAEIEHRVGSDGLQPGRRDFLDQYQNAVTPPPAAAGR